MKIKIKINEGKYSGYFLWGLKLSKTANAHFFSTFHRKTSPQGMFFLPHFIHFLFTQVSGQTPDTWPIPNISPIVLPATETQWRPQYIRPLQSQYINTFCPKYPLFYTFAQKGSSYVFFFSFQKNHSTHIYIYIYISPSHITNIFLYHFFVLTTNDVKKLLNFESNL